MLFATGGEGKMSASGGEFEVSEGWIFFVGWGVEVEFVTESGLEILLGL